MSEDVGDEGGDARVIEGTAMLFLYIVPSHVFIIRPAREYPAINRACLILIASFQERVYEWRHGKDSTGGFALALHDPYQTGTILTDEDVGASATQTLLPVSFLPLK